MEKYAIYPFEFGFLKIGYDGEIITLIRTAEERVQSGERTSLTDDVYSQITEYLQGSRREFSFPYRLCGTAFQEKVWKELCNIPYGETRSYKEIAEAIGNPKAGRAVGAANNKNPIMIAVPCHRVIGADGKLVGYAGGLKMKAALLRRESQTK